MKANVPNNIIGLNVNKPDPYQFINDHLLLWI